jgi:hypothetical protein
MQFKTTPKPSSAFGAFTFTAFPDVNHATMMMVWA